MVFHHFFKGEQLLLLPVCYSFQKMVCFYETWLPKKHVLFFCSECNKGFAPIGLPPLGKQTESHQTCSIHVGPLSCLESRKVFTEVLVKIYFTVLLTAEPA